MLDAEGMAPVHFSADRSNAYDALYALDCSDNIPEADPNAYLNHE